MDSSWHTKCDSTFQQSTHAIVSSVSQEPRSQMEVDSSHCIYPQVAHGLRSKFGGGMQDPTYPRFPYTNNYASGHADAENSFLGLLSGPPSLLQCELQELSDPKPYAFSGNFSAASGNFVVDSVGSGTFPTTGKGLMTENLSNHKLQTKADTFPVITSRAMVGLSSGINNVFPDIQRADTSIQPSVPGSENSKDARSSTRQRCGTTPASNQNIYSSYIQAVPNITFEGSFPKMATPFMGGCPRVFCMGKSGYLLLSNTGLLGIVCSCHCCHMSVLKFCEHSGLHDVNPGDAVRMESGETIAQWRKLYFLKFGIRSPGNESEWDWPEVLSISATVSLMKSNATNSNMSKSDLSHPFNSSMVSLRPGKPSDNVMFPKDAPTGHHRALSKKQQTTIQNGCNIPIKGSTDISRSNLHDGGDSQFMEFNTTPPNFVGTQWDDSSLLIPAYLDSLKRSGNLFVANSPSQNPTSLLKDLDFNVNKNANEGSVGRDASSSNIELRLGQPPQTGNPVLSVMEPQQFDALVSPPKLQYLKQMTQNSAESLSREEELQNNFCYAAGPSKSKMVEEQSQLKLRNYMSGVNNGLGAARARSETNNVAKGSVFSSYSLFNSQSRGNTKANEHLENDGGLIMSKILHSGSNTLHPTNVLWKSDDHRERQLNNSSLGNNKVLDNDKGAAGESSANIDSGSRTSKIIELPSFMRAVGGSSDCCISAVNGKISCHEPSLSVDASAGANFSCGSNRVSSVGQDSHVTLRSLGSQLASGMPAEGILMGCPFLVSSSTSNQTPTLLGQEVINVDTCLLDENMRLLALTQILELSKQQHALYLREMNQTQRRSCNFPNSQHSIYEASTSRHGNSDVTLKSPLKNGTCANHGITDDLEKLASLTGLNRFCCLSTLASRPLHSTEKELQCKRYCDLRYEEPSLSLGRSKGITRSYKCETCSKQPLDPHLVDRCTCAAQVNCSGNNFMLGVGPSTYNFRQPLANTSGETSLMIASNFTVDQNASKDKNNQFVQGAECDSQYLKKISSHTPQWRDVPSKVRKGVCDVGSLVQPAVILDCERQSGDQLGNVPDKRLKRTTYLEDSMNQQESSSVSSGCSAPVVTQLSVEVNNVDSSTVDAADNQYFDNLVVDEGSSIDKSWSSEALESDRSAEFLGSTCDTYLKKAYLRVLNDQPRRSLLDELKLLDSLTWKKGRDQNHAKHSVNCKTNQSLKVKRGVKGKKRKRMEIRMLDAMFPSEIPSLLHNKNDESTGAADFPSNLPKEVQMYFASGQQRSTAGASFVQHSTTRRAAFSSKFLSCKNHLRKHNSDRDGQNSYKSESDCDAEIHKFTEVSGRKDFISESFRQFQKQEPACEKPENDIMKSFHSRQVNAFRKTRPVVCGKYGEISGGIFAGEVTKPAKIVSLSEVLKVSEKCRVATNDKFRLTSKKKRRKLSSGTSNGHSGLKTKDNNGTPNALVCQETNIDISEEDLERSNKPLVICDVKRDVKAKQDGSIVDRIHAPLKLKGREIRKRSIYELTAKETRVKKILEFAEEREHDFCNTNSKNSFRSVQEHGIASNMDTDAFCCVCRSSSNDEINYLLECSRCQIRVHQACYGIATLPKGRWCCRPCRTNSKDIACVLCGYGGGAMTRALRTHSIVKSLLKVWNIEKEVMSKHTIPHERFEKEMGAFHSTKSALEGDQTCVSRPANIETSTNILKVEITTKHMQHTPKFNIQNSITAGVSDTTVKQWIHMVCGLWTPGTRCPNVDTMSAFDVSDVSRPKADTACSICNRWGGSCIECRVVGCSVQFHPWCAHQKNLLQSEAEGVDGDKVGFYGRCVHHANDLICQAKHDLIGTEMGCLEKMKSTCARTEGYKGRRQDGFQHNCYGVVGKGGCLVPQEQLNAWIHINGQKLCSQGLPKFPASDVEYDCRKEYARYKQAKGWKHLVVYKSGIHALGLYTSRFISRGEMVVEYVGEIVGLRVADKREIEYQSGRKLQYKSACYFFRIDKEHIIDATRKGGIARFVNHSCLPNCVAKVISVRHEKKVVFFAERDIFPGEEITYDYHFNHEDEGQKIPCYCNSKNCRRYLN